MRLMAGIVLASRGSIGAGERRSETPAARARRGERAVIFSLAGLRVQDNSKVM
jgi:hypothetical protein